ncbi:MAG: DUF3267 domain-containing protein [Bacilli bacterium]|nr:DUF3267 domain-containing protein [Bacilli bacterium]
MSNIGDIVVFGDEEYCLLENNIIPQSKNNHFMLWMNVAAIGMFVVLLIGSLLLMFGESMVGELNIINVFLFLLSFILFIVVHELLHGMAFMLFGKVKSKHIKFGLILKSGVAYCISTVPVKVWASRLSLMMPVYVVCLPLYVYSIFSHNIIILIASLLYFTGSIGDIYYMWKLRNTDRNTYMFEEAPTAKGYKIGYLLFQKKEKE